MRFKRRFLRLALILCVVFVLVTVGVVGAARRNPATARCLTYHTRQPSATWMLDIDTGAIWHDRKADILYQWSWWNVSPGMQYYFYARDKNLFWANRRTRSTGLLAPSPRIFFTRSSWSPGDRYFAYIRPSEDQLQNPNGNDAPGEFLVEILDFDHRHKQVIPLVVMQK